jgi:hypothetical protein
MAKRYQCGNQKCLLITPFLYVGHCIVCPTLIYAFWLPYWYLLAIASSVLLRFMPSDYPFRIIWPLYRLSYFDLKIYIEVGQTIQWPKDTNVVIRRHQSKYDRRCYMLAIVSSVLFQSMPSDYPFVICWPLYRLSYFNQCLLITPLLYVGHCIISRTDDTMANI